MCFQVILAYKSIVLCMCSGKYIDIYFIMKITFLFLQMDRSPALALVMLLFLRILIVLLAYQNMHQFLWPNCSEFYVLLRKL